jgi:exopolysaccharide/PEP-CTERM locus tyrosine autokinase
MSSQEDRASEAAKTENRARDVRDEYGEPSDLEQATPGSQSRELEKDPRLLVPSSLELGEGAVDKYVISKQIARMQEPRRLTADDLAERRIVYPDSPERVLVNRFRDLRTKLLELSGGNNFTLVVSGASEHAGSSFVALNLAAAFAFDQSKTAVIVDCNLREPSLNTALDIMPEAGLTDFLEDPDYEIGRIIYPTGIPRLRLIPAGTCRENPAEFFTSFRMKQFLRALRRRYPDRFIVLDTAPISDSPDARILTDLCDYGLLVVPHGKLTPGKVENAARAFNPDKFVGAVING